MSKLLAEALDNIDDAAAFLPLALSALRPSGRQARQYVRHTREGTEVAFALRIGLGNDRIEWTHSLLAKLKNPFRKQRAMLAISQVRRVQLGQKTATFKLKREKKKSVGEKFEARSFSIVTNNRTIDVVAPSEMHARVWVRALELLVQEYQREGNSFQTFIESQWDQADTDGSGTLTQDEVLQVLRLMNINFKKKWFLTKFNEFDLDKSKSMDKTEFAQFSRSLFSDRPEVACIMQEIKAISKANGGALKTLDDRLTLHEYSLFWNTFQKSEVDDYMDEEAAKSVFQQIVGDETDSIDKMEFAMLLDASENSAFDPARTQPGCGLDTLEAYMSQPLNHYWINSSHNTYLTGDQLQSYSDVQQYGFVLQRGARCVELDCWDGEDHENPIIFHGHTLTTKIKFRDVIEEIKEESFGPPANNPYPVIMSIENHCSQAYQEKMAKIVTEIMGESVYRYDASKPFPSPEDLKYKFLFKADMLSLGAKDDELLGDADNSENDDDVASAPVDQPVLNKWPAEAKKTKAPSKTKSSEGTPKKINKEHHYKIAEEWSCLVGLPTNKEKKKPLRQIIEGLKGPSFKMQSYAEGGALKMSEKNREDFVEFNRYLLSRIYPFGGRVDSSNMNPIPFWSAGCHAVCLNFQTGDLGMSLNHGKFRENNSLGYVLKHPSQRATGIASSSCRLKVCILSCQRLPAMDLRDTDDVYVRVEVHGTGTDSTDSNRTRTIQDNGFNPTFGEKGQGETFTFDIQDRESAMLRFVVMDEDISSGDDFIGQYSVPVTCIRKGYRHLSLFDKNDVMLPHAGVLCRFEFEPIPDAQSEDKGAKKA